MLLNGWNKLDEVYGGIVGSPSYDEYVKHINKHHPEQKPLSKAEFFKLANENRGKRPRCC